MTGTDMPIRGIGQVSMSGEDLPIRADQELMLEQLCGPIQGMETGFTLPWYSAPYPNGKKISRSTEAGTLFGPVREVYQIESRG